MRILHHLTMQGVCLLHAESAEYAFRRLSDYLLLVERQISGYRVIENENVE